MYESLVRASSIQYFVDNKGSENQIKKMIIAEETKGFLWIGQLIGLFKNYTAHRDIYPTLSAFMPEIAKWYRDIAPGIDKLKSDYESQCAHVEAIEPFAVKGTPKYSEDGRYLIISVLLKPEWDYSFMLMPWSFRTLDEYPLVTYEVKSATSIFTLDSLSIE